MKGQDFTIRLPENLNQRDLPIFWPSQNFTFLSVSMETVKKEFQAAESLFKVAHILKNINKKYLLSFATKKIKIRPNQGNFP